MTAKKGLKLRVRRRQAQTGERYTTALTRVRAKERAGVEIDQTHDVTPWAELEDFRCKVVVSEDIWRAESAHASAADRFRLILSRLRALLQSSKAEPAGALLCAAVFEKKGMSKGIPNAMHEMAESRRFLAQVKSGVRGLSRNGRMVAFDVPGQQGPTTLLGVFLFPPFPGDGRSVVLWLTSLQERDARCSEGVGALLEKHLALAGLGMNR